MFRAVRRLPELGKQGWSAVMSRVSERLRRSMIGVSGVCGAVVAGVVAAVIVASTLAQQPPPLDRQQAWNKVRDAMSKGLPKTAIQELKPIIADAMRAKRYPEAIKATGLTIA